MSVLTRQVLLTTTGASATGDWYPLDYRFNSEGAIRTFTGSLTAGDTVYLEVTNDDPSAVTTIVTVSAFTATPFLGALSGPFAAIRFRKTGTTGAASVTGVV